MAVGNDYVKVLEVNVVYLTKFRIDVRDEEGHSEYSQNRKTDLDWKKHKLREQSTLLDVLNTLQLRK